MFDYLKKMSATEFAAEIERAQLTITAAIIGERRARRGAPWEKDHEQRVRMDEFIERIDAARRMDMESFLQPSAVLFGSHPSGFIR